MLKYKKIYPNLKRLRFIAGEKHRAIYLGKHASDNVIEQAINHETLHIVMCKLKEEDTFDQFLYHEGTKRCREKQKFMLLLA